MSPSPVRWPEVQRHRLQGIRVVLIALAAGLAGGNQLAWAGEMEIDAAWVRPTPPTVMRTAVYLRIRNLGLVDDEFVAVSSPAARVAEVHTMRMRDGMMAMEPLQLPIPVGAGAELIFRPGGAHIMLVDLDAPIREGDRVTVTIQFAKTGAVAVVAEASDIPPAAYSEQGADASEYRASRRR